MSVINGANAVVGSSTQYQISRSLRFNSADSAYLNRTPASAGSGTTWTWNAWVKIANTSSGAQNIFSAGNNASGTRFNFFLLNPSNTLRIDANGVSSVISTTPMYRDFSAWYMITVVWDTTQATSSNRVKLYINGAQVTAFATTNYPAQNATCDVNTTKQHFIGQDVFNNSDRFNGYLTEINFIDGQALTPSSFGETDTVTGVWKPKKYTGSYGTNGFYLNFSDNSGTTSTTLGKDSSGNGNNWTPNNFSVTAGAGNDSLVDTPTPYGTDTGVGGEVRGNYATWNPLRTGANMVPTNGNLDVVTSATVAQTSSATFGVSTGKWYWEVTNSGGFLSYTGIVDLNHEMSTYIGSASNGSGYAYNTSGEKVGPTSGTTAAYGATYTSGDVIGVALDMDAGTLVFYKNGVSQGTAFSSLTGTWFPAVSGNGVAGKGGTLNAGQRPFAYTAPSGFKALCTQNLPEPTIVDGGDYFNTVLYTGNATAGRSVTGVGFAPDLVWIKNRSAAQSNILSNKLGANGNYLISNNTDFESVVTNVITSLDSDGFTVGSNATTNGSGNAMVAWNWKAGGTPATTNTAGTITSTVSVNTTSGFSIVNYTGTGANATVGHGLGVAPSMIIVKARSNVTDWIVYSSILGKSAGLMLNSTGASFSNTDYWGTGGVTSTVFGLKGGGFSHNVSGYTYVAYCFAPVAGYSAFGSFVGNGNADGPFVYTGFKPAFVMCKGTTTTTHWVMSDSKRPGYNVTPNALFANLSNAEATDRQIDLLSNGFKLRQGNLSPNDSGVTFIYMAFAETPFSLSLAR